MTEVENVGLITHSGHLYSLAAKAYERCLQARKEGKAREDDAITAVVLAAASLEGFINDLVLLSAFVDEPPNLVILSKDWEDFEKLSIQAKYLLIALMLGRPLEKGINPYQDFQLLIQLRNALVHLKAAEILFEQGKLRWRETGILKKLAAKKLTCEAEAPSWYQLSSWYSQVSTAEIAAWACDTTVAMVCHLRDCLAAGALKKAVNLVIDQWFKEVPKELEH